jgi:hypothetical protein
MIVISNWVTADPSASKDSVRSHVHSNILAIKHGLVNHIFVILLVANGLKLFPV